MALAAGAAPAAYPEQPIKLVVPFAPGGPTDLAARILATAMGRTLPQNVVVDNRPGAGGRVGLSAVATAKPDGYTVFLAGPSSLVVQSALQPPLPFDPQKQFTPAGVFAFVPLMLVGAPNLPGNFKEAVALYKSQPGKHSYGSAGVGTSSHFGPFVIFQMLGADLVHVPYKGTGPALLDVQAGRVSLALDSVANSSPKVKAGELKGLVILEKNRVPQLPEVPSAAETFPEILKYDWTSWFGVVAPTGTPNEAVELLNRALAAASKDPELVKRFADLGMNPTSMTLPETRRFIDRQFESWVPTIKAMNLKLD
jgi:tripartite-type tricarboxylate transporter receptor subunit TctC